MALLEAGHRVITYDRRGFGESSKPTSGYDYDTFAEDLNKLITHLELKDFTLVGFSMGGGEVARYLGKYGSKCVSQAVFISSIPPFLLKTADNPGGVDGGIFEEIKKGLVADRPAFLAGFLSNFYNVDVLGAGRAWEPTRAPRAQSTSQRVKSWLLSTNLAILDANEPSRVGSRRFFFT